MPVTMLEAAFGTVAALVVPALAVGLHAPLEHERSVPVAATVEIGERIVDFPAPGEFLSGGVPAAAPAKPIMVAGFRMMTRQVSPSTIAALPQAPAGRPTHDLLRQTFRSPGSTGRTPTHMLAGILRPLANPGGFRPRSRQPRRPANVLVANPSPQRRTTPKIPRCAGYGDTRRKPRPGAPRIQSRSPAATTASTLSASRISAATSGNGLRAATAASRSRPRAACPRPSSRTAAYTCSRDGTGPTCPISFETAGVADAPWARHRRIWDFGLFAMSPFAGLHAGSARSSPAKVPNRDTEIRRVENACGSLVAVAGTCQQGRKFLRRGVAAPPRRGGA